MSNGKPPQLTPILSLGVIAGITEEYVRKSIREQLLEPATTRYIVAYSPEISQAERDEWREEFGTEFGQRSFKLEMDPE